MFLICFQPEKPKSIIAGIVHFSTSQIAHILLNFFWEWTFLLPDVAIYPWRISMHIWIKYLLLSLLKKWSFPLRIFSENVTKSARMVTFTGEILNEKLNFLCSVWYFMLVTVMLCESLWRISRDIKKCRCINRI